MQHRSQIRRGPSRSVRKRIGSIHAGILPGMGQERGRVGKGRRHLLLSDDGSHNDRRFVAEQIIVIVAAVKCVAADPAHDEVFAELPVEEVMAGPTDQHVIERGDRPPLETILLGT
jgi:hypothetical protein